jgi:dihydroneopterin aldolase
MKGDRILISSIDCVVAIGVTREERTIKQRVVIDVEFLIDCRRPAKTDSIKDTIDYARVAREVAGICAERYYRLIETLAERIAERVLAGFPTPAVRVLVRKIAPVVDPKLAHVSVEIERGGAVADETPQRRGPDAEGKPRKRPAVGHRPR